MFINLHMHDCKGSIRDAIAKPKEIANKVAELGQLGYASTNHGSASSLLTHYNICKSKNLKFVFGIEAYICDYISIREKYDYKHICLFAKDMTGYQNILKLVSISYDKGFYYKPRIDWDILMQHKDGLIVSSACLGGILGIKDSNGNFDKLAIMNTAEKYKKAFGDDFYIEIQTNQMSEQIEFNKLLIDLCHNLQIPFIATCDSHYVNKEDAWIHRHWNGIDDNEENGYYQTDDFYIHSEGEVVRALQYLNGVDVQCAIYNTVELFNKCNVVLPEGEDNFPIFECNSQVEKVKEICRVGWKNKIMGIIPKDKQQVYLDRFLEEMDILEKANYLNMMLITWDYMKWGREQGIRFGSGRGSVGGSLVAYLMDLTKVDPVANNLIFSRFCNLERVTTADKNKCPLLWKHSNAKSVNHITHGCTRLVC